MKSPNSKFQTQASFILGLIIATTKVHVLKTKPNAQDWTGGIGTMPNVQCHTNAKPITSLNSEFWMTF